MYAAITATISAGSIFATLTFLPQTRFTPTQKINTDPTSDRFDIADSVIIGATSFAKRVTRVTSFYAGSLKNRVHICPDNIKALSLNLVDFVYSIKIIGKSFYIAKSQLVR